MSCEVQALDSLYSDLEGSLTPADVAGKCFSKGIISREDLNVIEAPGTVHEKTAALLSAVRRSVVADGKYFYTFLDILSKEPKYRQIVKRGKKGVQEFRSSKGRPQDRFHVSCKTDKESKQDGAVPIQGTKDRSASVTTGGKSIVQKYCGCGKCDFKKIISHGCPTPKKTTLMYLNHSDLSLYEKNTLIAQLQNNANSISESLSTVSLEFMNWMEQNVTLEEYKKALSCIIGIKNLAMLGDRCNDIQKAQNHRECFYIVKDYFTWFNCSMLRQIVKLSKSSTPKDPFFSVIDEYNKMVEEYCKRSIFECPPPKNMSYNEGTTYLVLKVAKDIVTSSMTTGEDIILFTTKLTECFQLQEPVLQLCTVDQGCLELVYCVPMCMYSELFPLNEVQCKDLQALGVLEIITKDCHYKSENDTLQIQTSENTPTDISTLSSTNFNTRGDINMCSVLSTPMLVGKSYKEQCTATGQMVQMEISEEDICTITGCDFDWRCVGQRLVGDQKIRDNDNEGGSEEDKRDRMLLEWKRTNGHKATYSALVEVLRELKYNAIADQVEELKKAMPPQDGIQNVPGEFCHGSCGSCDQRCLIEKQHQCPMQIEVSKHDTFDNLLETFMYHLHEEHKPMSSALPKLKKEFEKVIDKVNLTELKSTLRTLEGIYESRKGKSCMLNDRTREINAAKYHEDCYRIVYEYVTWFNADLLNIIVKNVEQYLKTKQSTDLESFKCCKADYDKAFECYCKREVFQCPADSLLPKTKSTSSFRHFSLILADKMINQLQDIKNFEGELITRLRIKGYCLRLCSSSIGNGYVELVYLLPACVHKKLFPLHKELLESLLKLGVTDIGVRNHRKSILLLQHISQALDNEEYESVTKKLDNCLIEFNELMKECYTALKDSSVEDLIHCSFSTEQAPDYIQYMQQDVCNPLHKLAQFSTIKEFIDALCQQYADYLMYQKFENIIVSYGNEKLNSDFEIYKEMLSWITIEAKVTECLKNIKLCKFDSSEHREVIVAIKKPFIGFTIFDIEAVTDEMQNFSWMFQFCHLRDVRIIENTSATMITWMISHSCSQYLKVDIFLNYFAVAIQSALPEHPLVSLGVLQVLVDGQCVFQCDPIADKVILTQKIMMEPESEKMDEGSQMTHHKPDDLSLLPSNVTRIFQNFSVEQWHEFAICVGLSIEDITYSWFNKSQKCKYQTQLVQKWLSKDINATWYAIVIAVKQMLPPASYDAEIVEQKCSDIAAITENQLIELENVICNLQNPDCLNIQNHFMEEKPIIFNATSNLSTLIQERFLAAKEVLNASHDELREKSNSKEYWDRIEKLDKELIQALAQQIKEMDSILRQIWDLCLKVYSTNEELVYLIQRVHSECKAIEVAFQKVREKENLIRELKMQLIPRLKMLKSQNIERVQALVSIPEKVMGLRERSKKNSQGCSELNDKRIKMLKNQASSIQAIRSIYLKKEIDLFQLNDDLSQELKIWESYFTAAATTAVGSFFGLLAGGAIGAIGAVFTAGTTFPVTVASAAAAITGATVGGFAGAAFWISNRDTKKRNLDTISREATNYQQKRLCFDHECDKHERDIMNLCASV